VEVHAVFPIFVKFLDYSKILLIWLRRIIMALSCHIPGSWGLLGGGKSVKNFGPNIVHTHTHTKA